MLNREVSVPPEFIKGIKELTIDASSMIYLLKIGLLGSLAAEIELVTTEVVFKEVGWSKLPVKKIEIDAEGLTNDQTILALAGKRNHSLLSEDLEILEEARKSGWNYYNSLMMLNYLLLKGRVLESEYNEYLERLRKISRYSNEVIDYGVKIYNEIIKML